MKKRLLALGLFGLFIAANASFSVPQQVNAWRSVRKSSNTGELETSLISNTIDTAGYRHYKYHIKNVGKIYCTEFCLSGAYLDGQELKNQYDIKRVENDLFDYETLVVGPNQEVDVEFVLPQSFSNIDNVAIGANGYCWDYDEELVTSARLTSNVLSSADHLVHLTYDSKDAQNNGNFIAVLKTNIDSEDYYFVAQKDNGYVVSGKYGINGDVQLDIELVRVIKTYIYASDGQFEDHNHEGDFRIPILLIIFGPIVIGILIMILIGAIIAIATVRTIKKGQPRQ